MRVAEKVGGGSGGRDGECVMMDYHTVKRIDNTRLVRHAAPARLHDLWRLCAAGGRYRRVPALLRLAAL